MNCRNPSNILEKIACAMVNSDSSTHFGTSDVDAGMTYIGQMISHDIVPPTKKNSLSPNVTPYLDLDSVYGNFPSYVYKHAPENTIFLDCNGRFKTSQLNGVRDLNRRETSTGWEAVIPEPRNDENRIISQLHLFWQDVHNWILDNRLASDALEAKKFTTLLFQLVTIEGFCKSLFRDEAFNIFFGTNVAPISLSDHFSKIPPFFSKASFRFGHSAVRDSYTLNRTYPEKHTAALLGKGMRLKKDIEIDWKLFFNSNDALNKASKIDTFAIDVLRNVPNFAQQPGFDVTDVLLFNLRASGSIRPPEAAAYIKTLSAQEFSILKDCGFEALQSLSSATFRGVSGLTANNLLLWTYILLEAEYKEASIKLGALGSFLNARVLYSAISHSKFSVIDREGYCFNKALSMLGRRLSNRIESALNWVSMENSLDGADSHPVMEALIFLVK